MFTFAALIVQFLQRLCLQLLKSVISRIIFALPILSIPDDLESQAVQEPTDSKQVEYIMGTHLAVL